MKSRIIAIVFAVVSLCGVASQQIGPARPSLLIFCGPGPDGGPCGPCQLFKADLYGGNPRLMPSLQRDFARLVMLDSRQHASRFKEYRVDRWPTFIAIDADGTELQRVVGYDTAVNLWRDITRQANDNRQPVEPISRSKLDPPPPKPATSAAGEPDLKSEISDLKSKPPNVECIDGVCRIIAEDATKKAAELSQRMQQLQQDLAHALDTNKTLQQRIINGEHSIADQSTALQNQIADLRNQIDALSRLPRGAYAETGDVADGDGHADTITLPQIPPRSTVAAPSDSGSPSVFRRIFRGLVTTAVSAGLTAAQAEVGVGVAAIGGPAGMAIWAGLAALTLLRKKKALTKSPGDDAESGDNAPRATPKAATGSAEDFKIENLPLQHIDYTSCWAEHWRNQHADPATALRELELYVQAWQAVKSGALALPGIDNVQSVFESLNRWVNRQVMDHAQKALTGENTNHKVFYAHTWKEATHNIREGTFRTWKPNPPAADAIEDWVAARLTEKLTTQS